MMLVSRAAQLKRTGNMEILGHLPRGDACLIEVILVVTLGAVAARTLVGPASWGSHLITRFMGPMALEGHSRHSRRLTAATAE